MYSTDSIPLGEICVVPVQCIFILIRIACDMQAYRKGKEINVLQMLHGTQAYVI